MCQAKVYLDGKQIMEDVVYIEQIERGVLLSKFFEEPVQVAAAVRSIDLLKHTVNLESGSETDSSLSEERS